MRQQRAIVKVVVIREYETEKLDKERINMPFIGSFNLRFDRA